MKIIRLIIFSLLFIVLFNIYSFANGWEKLEDGRYRYIKDGAYVSSDFVYDNEQIYIMDANGILIQASWTVFLDKNYYASPDGSLYKDGKYQINSNYYYFDKNGVLLKGWIDDIYYANDEGYLVSGFQNLICPEHWYLEDEEDKNTNCWFYFDPQTCKKVFSNNDTYITKSVNGKRYCFDQNGIMKTGWRQVKEQTPPMKGYMYFIPKETDKFKFGEGLSSTWYSLEPPVEILNDHEVRYFYFSATGFLKVAQAGSYLKGRVSTKTYLFNEYGYCVYGIRKLNDEYYYFGPNSSACSMKTGKIVLNDTGESLEYYFDPNDDGKGYSGVYNDKLYYKGLLQKADSYSKYVAYKVRGTIYLVNTSGSIVKNKKKIKDGDGVSWTTDSSGIVIFTDEGIPINPEPPEVSDD